MDLVLKESKYFIMATRGCPFACAYCSNSYLHNLYAKKSKHVRKRNVSNVMKELLYAKKLFKNLKTISFLDEVFVLDKNWIKEFVREYKQNVNVEFRCEFYPSTVSDG
tara:strand:- start:654 stop:977 length:324 start_codon:yes stop_codon:yes gene_type:complete